jgi:hypothetical protein
MINLEPKLVNAFYRDPACSLSMPTVEMRAPGYKCTDTEAPNARVKKRSVVCELDILKMFRLYCPFKD